MAEKHRFTMILPARLWEWVGMRAALDGASRGAFVRRILEEERKRYRKEGD